LQKRSFNIIIFIHFFGINFVRFILIGHVYNDFTPDFQAIMMRMMMMMTAVLSASSRECIQREKKQQKQKKI